MKDPTTQTPEKSFGLTPLVKEQLLATLMSLVPQWQTEPALDYKQVVRPTGVDSSSITIEPYQGTQSWMTFRQKVVGTEIIQSLEKLVHEQQPELLGYVIYDYAVGGRQIQNAFALCMALCKETMCRIKSSVSLKAAVSSVVSDLDNLLITEIVEGKVVSILNGLKLPDQVGRVDLAEGLYLRSLTIDEIVEFGSNDILSRFRYDFSPLSATTALIYKKKITVKLSPDNKAHSAASAKPLLDREQIKTVLEALHILKSGCIGVVASFITIHPTVLPNMNGNSCGPLVSKPCREIRLNHEDTKNLIKLYKELVATQRSELKIAAARLVDAESRTSLVDALLDAVIGLEALLNPHDYSELSFRVALNYAFLNPADRRNRYDNIHDIQKSRNKVVHGGLNKDASRLHKHAQLAKDCLRDALTRFLTDESLMGDKKLDAHFWLDRVLPPDSNS